ncbi:MAG: NAD(P)H-hydrate dehydratase [Actinomycetes bacterium]
MEPVLTPAEMAAADRRTIDGGTPFDTLVGRAGRAVARAVLAELGGAYGRRVVVVCGKGSNGADGRVAAAALAARGVRVAVLDLAAFDPARLERELGRADLVVDAMYGTGLRGPLVDAAAACVDAFAAAGLPVVAIDIPSGIDGATGAATGMAVRAVRTVTFAAWKPGLLLEPGRTHAGRVSVADIGIDLGLAHRDPSLGLVTAADLAAWLPPRDPSAHKWSVGPLLVVGGSPGLEGAPRLAAAAALRAGSGIVWCATPGAATAEPGPGELAEVVGHPLPVGPSGSLDDAAVDHLLADALGARTRFGALVLGPGLGTGTEVAGAVRRLLAAVSVPVLLDADGLTALAGDLGPLRDRAAAGHRTVLTPHEGEFARLAGPVCPDRVAAARRLAADSGATVLLKGPGTVVSDPDGSAAISTPGGPWLATAGTGDVLAGILGSLLARGLAPQRAAAGAAWLHGRAADLAGHTSLVAGDVVAALPRVIATATAPGHP